MPARPDHDEIEYEAQRIAYSVLRAEREGDRESGGWWALRGTFAALLFALGEREEPIPPGFDDDEDEPVAESKFQTLLERHAAAFPAREAADKQGQGPDDPAPPAGDQG